MNVESYNALTLSESLSESLSEWPSVALRSDELSISTSIG